MTLNEEIKTYEAEIHKLTGILGGLKKRCAELKTLTEIDSVNVIRDIEINDFILVSFEVKEGLYEYILGGDGRSQPWSENRKGIIAYVKINSIYYLSNENRDTVIKYLKATRKYNDVNIL